MMYKKRMVVVLCLILCLCLMLGMAPYSQEGINSLYSVNEDISQDTLYTQLNTDLNAELKAGDILLVYDTIKDQETLVNIEAITTMASYIRKVIDYGLWADMKDVANQYEYIIFYEIDNPEADMLEFCKDKEHNCMFIGTESLKAYLSYIGRENVIEDYRTDLKAVMDYNLGSGQNFCKIFNNVDLLTFVKEESTNSGSLMIDGEYYSVFKEVEGVYYYVLSDFTSNEAKAAFMNELVWWMWPYNDQPKEYAQYLVLDEIYPFMNPETLLNEINMLLDENIPFIISVMPFMENVQYPAVKEYCQVLSYAQAKGALIILHAPIMHKKADDLEEIHEMLTDMTLSYVENGVYPLGIEVPEKWIYNEYLLEALERYTTVFIYDDGSDTEFSLRDGTSLYTRQGHQSIFSAITIDETKMAYVPYYSSAVYINYTVNTEELKQIIKVMKDSGQPTKDLTKLNHKVWLDNNSIIFDMGQLYFNNEKVDVSFKAYEFEDDFDYEQTVLQKISISLESQNRYLIGGAVVIMIMFSGFIAITRIRNRRSFFYYDNENDPDDKRYESDTKE